MEISWSKAVISQPKCLINAPYIHMKPRLKIPHIVHIELMGEYNIVGHPKNFRCECVHNCYIQYNEHSPLFLFRGVDELNTIMTVCWGRNSFNSMPPYRFSIRIIWRKGWIVERTLGCSSKYFSSNHPCC